MLKVPFIILARVVRELISLFNRYLTKRFANNANNNRRLIEIGEDICEVWLRANETKI